MAGALAWHRATARYPDTALRAAYLGFVAAPPAWAPPPPASRP